MADLTKRRPMQVVRTIPSTPLVTVRHDIWEPPTDVYETENEIIIKVDIAGIEDGDMEVTLEESLLHVHGYRSDCSAFNKLAVHRMEIPCGEFETHVHLPHAVRTDGEIECTYRAGMLNITLLKQAAHRVHVTAEE